MVVTDGNEFWREGRVVGGVAVDLFFNPMPKLQARLHEGDEVVLQAIATGDVLFDRHHSMEDVVKVARSLWSMGPSVLSDWDQTLLRYRIGCLTQDLEDAADDRSPSTLLLATELVRMSLESYLALHRQWPVPAKHLLARVSQLDPQLGKEATNFFSFPNKESAVGIADRVIGPCGGRVTVYSIQRARINPAPSSAQTD
jgi:hypothetical protein